MPDITLTLLLAIVFASPFIAYAWRQRLVTQNPQLHGDNTARNSTQYKIERIIRNLIEAVPRPIIVMNPDRVIVDANRAALYMVALPRERVIGRVLAAIVQDYETTEMLIAAAETGAPQEHTIKRTANDETWHVSVQPLHLPNPLQQASVPATGVSHLLLFIDDETQLRYLETVRKDFVASVSHELRTPLASVKLLAETLVDTIATDVATSMRMSDRIIVEVDRLTELVDDLLELSRIENGRINLELEPTDVSGIIEVAAERMSALAKERQIQLETNIIGNLPEVQADGERIEQVLINLIHNAVKFTPEGGKIILSAECGMNDEARKSLMKRDPAMAHTLDQHESVVIIRVHDTGIGITDEDLPRVFERFFKARELPTRGKHTENARNEKGTGLGLAISRYIIEAHRGNIWAESQLGRSSTFSFTLPLAKTLDSTIV